MPTPEDLSRTSDKVVTKAASLVETAADIAADAFESAVDKADMVSAETANKLVDGAHQTKKLAKKNSRAIGIGAMIGAAVAVVGGLTFLTVKANQKKSKPAKK
ncbi:hypothetical protein HJC99_06865 [Candidatus Saccharibacteria bacterium]|nr:hypothetical protein [Candidatus Saccharibacteria bacterium]